MTPEASVQDSVHDKLLSVDKTLSKRKFKDPIKQKIYEHNRRKDSTTFKKVKDEILYDLFGHVPELVDLKPEEVAGMTPNDIADTIWNYGADATASIKSTYRDVSNMKFSIRKSSRNRIIKDGMYYAEKAGVLSKHTHEAAKLAESQIAMAGLERGMTPDEIQDALTERYQSILVDDATYQITSYFVARLWNAYHDNRSR